MRLGGSTSGSDESYLASVSDLVIGLLFIFIIMLMAYGFSYRQAEDSRLAEIDDLLEDRERLEAEALEIASDRDRLDAETATLTAQRDELLAQTEALQAATAFIERRDEYRRDLLEEIRAYMAARNIEVIIEPENGVLRLPEKLLFDTGEALLRPEGEWALGILADVLRQVLPCYSHATAAMRSACVEPSTPILETVLIEGHTDQRPIQTAEFRDNWELGAIRGINTFRALSAAQPDLELLANAAGEPLLGVSSYEARRPVGDPETDTGKARNRRIDLRFLVTAPTPSELDAISSRMLQDDRTRADDTTLPDEPLTE